MNLQEWRLLYAEIIAFGWIGGPFLIILAFVETAVFLSEIAVVERPFDIYGNL